MSSTGAQGPIPAPSALSRLVVTFLALPLYVMACCSPAMMARTISVNGRAAPIEMLSGWTVLGFGWLPPYTLAWSANILLLVALVLLWVGWTRASLIWSSLAVLLSLTTWLFFALGSISELLGGYFLWQASLLVVAIGALFLAKPRRND